MPVAEERRREQLGAPSPAPLYDDDDNDGVSARSSTKSRQARTKKKLELASVEEASYSPGTTAANSVRMERFTDTGMLEYPTFHAGTGGQMDHDGVRMTSRTDDLDLRDAKTRARYVKKYRKYTNNREDLSTSGSEPTGDNFGSEINPRDPAPDRTATSNNLKSGLNTLKTRRRIVRKSDRSSIRAKGGKGIKVSTTIPMQEGRMVHNDNEEEEIEEVLPGAYAHSANQEIARQKGLLTPAPRPLSLTRETDEPQQDAMSSEILIIEEEASSKKKRKKWILGVILLVLVVIVVVVVVLATLGESDSGDPPTAAPSEAPTQAPTMSICPEDVDWVDILDLCSLNDKIQHVIPPCMLPFYENVTDHLSFSVSFSESCTSATLARMALSFGVMMSPSGIDDPDLFFHLSNLYFSLDGPLNWFQNTGWLDHNVPRCDWYSVECDGDGVSIDLFGNEVGGSIPTEIGLFSSLDMLIVQGALLQGTIPSEICSITRLTQLEIFSPLLAGTLPSELANCENMIDLRVESKIEGSIPSELGRLSNLLVFELVSERLSGTIPQELLSIQTILALSVEGPVSGSFPQFFPNSLTKLLLLETRLTGEIPTQIGNLRRLNTLQIVSSRVDSTIPSEIGFLASLTDLSLESSFGITGTVPTEIGALTALEYLNLSGTRLGGTLPSELGLCTALSRVDVSQARFNGTIPAELCFLTGAGTLFVYDGCPASAQCLGNEC